MTDAAPPTTPDAAELVEQLLTEHGAAFGRDALPYGNHVRRVYRLVLAQLPDLSADEREQLAVAAVFHDIAIWLDGTFDYLDPSRDHAADYLTARGHADWIPAVGRLILEHHKLRAIKDDPLAEAFRKADLADLSFGLSPTGIPRQTYKALAREFPVHGFQRRLVRFTLGQTRKHPLHPLPMLRW